MATPTIIDYTTKRLGSRTPDGKIVKCAKCGRKGALHIGGIDMWGKPSVPDFVHHTVRQWNVGGITTRDLGDCCLLPTSARRQAMIDAWNTTYAATHKASEAKAAVIAAAQAFDAAEKTTGRA